MACCSAPENIFPVYHVDAGIAHDSLDKSRRATVAAPCGVVQVNSGGYMYCNAITATALVFDKLDRVIYAVNDMTSIISQANLKYCNRQTCSIETVLLPVLPSHIRLSSSAMQSCTCSAVLPTDHEPMWSRDKLAFIRPYGEQIAPVLIGFEDLCSLGQHILEVLCGILEPRSEVVYDCV